jgi:hypothetical protein
MGFKFAKELCEMRSRGPRLATIELELVRSTASMLLGVCNTAMAATATLISATASIFAAEVNTDYDSLCVAEGDCDGVRSPLDRLIGTALLSAFASCAAYTSFRVAGVPTFGRLKEVSIMDIEAAIAAYRKSEWGQPGPAEVISHDEIRIYQDSELRNYTSMVRVKGHWEVGAVMLVHPAY